MTTDPTIPTGTPFDRVDDGWVPLSLGVWCPVAELPGDPPPGRCADCHLPFTAGEVVSADVTRTGVTVRCGACDRWALIGVRIRLADLARTQCRRIRPRPAYDPALAWALAVSDGEPVPPGGFATDHLERVWETHLRRTYTNEQDLLAGLNPADRRDRLLARAIRTRATELLASTAASHGADGEEQDGVVWERSAAAEPEAGLWVIERSGVDVAAATDRLEATACDLGTAG